MVPSRNINGIRLPKSPTGQKRLDELCGAAETLLSSRSFFGLSVSDICGVANTAVGTFYIYFDDVGALCRYLAAKYGERLTTHMQTAARASSLTDFVRSYIKEFVRFGCENPRIFQILFGSVSVDFNAFKGLYTNFARALAESLDDRGYTADAQLFAYSLLGAAHFVCLKAIFDKNLTEERLELYADALSAMLRG
ncbi:MAG: TetR/AcrR family transcriptional regulator [Firmicutes bacterium]|nr:TetR/AcrR family transcriptional regulator [Bacillota bacterium]